MAEVKVTKDIENKTLIIEAVVNGSKDKVWQFYADKESFEKWWGPEGWETTTKEFDFRPGGRVHYDMHCVDKNQGKWYDQHSWGLMNIQEIDEGNRIVFEDAFTDETGVANSEMPVMQNTVEFSEADGKTKLVTHTVAETVEQLEEIVKMGAPEGWSSQLNKLDQLLAE